MRVVRESTGTTPIKLKVNLENMPYPTYKRLLVPPNINMMQLHFVLQYAMGWQFSHLFQFSDKKWRSDIIAGIQAEDDFDWLEQSKAEQVSLQKDFYEERDKKPFWYWYDFGDDWWHKITFQKPTKKDLEVYSGYPICIDGAGACPPEDVGGVWGYAEFLEAVQNKKHPEHEECRDWIGLEPGEKFDTAYKILPWANEILKGLPNAPEWKVTADTYFGGF